MAFAKGCKARQGSRVHAVGMKRPRIQNIVVPIDFSDMSIQAIRTARRVGRRFDATIHLAHVRQFDCAGLAAPALPMIPFSLMTYERNGDKSVLQELNALAREHGVSSATCHVLSGGPPFDGICRLAQKIPADLVVMPTHGRTGLKHVFLGSTAERVVQHSPCPVLVVREKKRKSKTRPPLIPRTILVPVDFSRCSMAGLQYAIGFANEFDAKIIPLHATYLGYIYSSDGTAIYDVRGLQQAARENAERQMRKLVRAVNFGRVKFEAVFTEGSPVLDICAFAEDHGLDLIIISTHGLTGWKHILIGSVAEKVARHAPCSVLVVPSHPQTRMANLCRAHAQTGRRSARKRSAPRPFLRENEPDALCNCVNGTHTELPRLKPEVPT
jgi:nucleotide-binding universal stress UspA family protein